MNNIYNKNYFNIIKKDDMKMNYENDEKKRINRSMENFFFLKKEKVKYIYNEIH
jgi:hypothetical protein